MTPSAPLPCALRPHRGPLSYRYLLRLLVERDLRERYAGSWLGISWSVLHPSAVFLLYYMVFSVILKVQPDPAYRDIAYSQWLMAGLAPWFFLNETLARSPGSVVEHARLVAKNAFPNWFLPAVTALSAFTNHLITLALLCAYLAWKGVLGPDALVWLCPWLCLLFCLCYGIALAFSALGVYFRDLAHLVGLLAMAWSFATPIFYPEAAVPERWRWVLSLNPAAWVVHGYRAALLGHGGGAWDGWPAAALGCVAPLLLGAWVFSRLRRGFGDLL